MAMRRHRGSAHRRSPADDRPIRSRLRRGVVVGVLVAATPLAGFDRHVLLAGDAPAATSDEGSIHVLDRYLRTKGADAPSPSAAEVDRAIQDIAASLPRACHLSRNLWTLLPAIVQRRATAVALDIGDRLGWGEGDCSGSLREAVFASSFLWMETLTRDSADRARRLATETAVPERANAWLDAYLDASRSGRNDGAETPQPWRAQVRALSALSGVPAPCELSFRTRLRHAVLETPVRVVPARLEAAGLLASLPRNVEQDTALIEMFQARREAWSADDWDASLLLTQSCWSSELTVTGARELVSLARAGASALGRGWALEALARAGSDAAVSQLLAVVQAPCDAKEGRSARGALALLLRVGLPGEVGLPDEADDTPGWWADRVREWRARRDQRR